MKKQAFNPILSSREYIPDGEPYVIGDKVYVYGSHDAFNGDYFCVNNYVCWSAKINDLGNWKFEGEIFDMKEDPRLDDKNKYPFAPDVVQGNDGRWYLYYTLASCGVMSVAVSDIPEGKYHYYGAVKNKDGRIIGTEKDDVFHFDPGVLNDNGKIYLYSGFSPREGDDSDKLFQGRKWDGSFCFELEDDMLTVKSEPKLVVPGIKIAKGTTFAEHPFFEASSIRKIKDKYYFVYSTTYGHELCYAVSDKPDEGFTFGGVVVSNGDIHFNGRSMKDALNYTGNNHGGMVEIDGQWYIFYHRHTNKSSFSRQTCAEKIYIDKDGNIKQAEMTSCGLNDGDLEGEGYYPAYIACNLYSKEGAGWVLNEDYRIHPYFTQSGGDDLNGEDQYIANLSDGAVAGFKYFDLSKTIKISVVVKTYEEGHFIVTDGKRKIAEIPLVQNNDLKEVTVPVSNGKNHSAIYFKYEGNGSCDFIGFTLYK